MSNDTLILLLITLSSCAFFLSVWWTLSWLLVRWSPKPMSRAQAMLVSALMCFIATTAMPEEKGPVTPPVKRYIAQFVTIIFGSGEVLDPSGRLMSKTAEIALTQSVESTQRLVDIASNAVVGATQQLDEALYGLTNTPYNVVYIAADLPRAMPNVWTNHNLVGTIEKTGQEGTSNYVAWVWFSQEPFAAPKVRLDYSIREGEVHTFVPVTNSFPETTLINNTPCVKYTYKLPEEVRGITFRPKYELEFGAPGEPLKVPSGGLVITDEDDNVYHGAFTTVEYSENLSITYQGGIATSAVYYGTNITGQTTL